MSYLRQTPSPPPKKTYFVSETSSLALQGVFEKLINHNDSEYNSFVHPDWYFEYLSCSWVCTKLKELFSERDWIISPQRRAHGRGMPDFYVEKAIRKHAGHPVEMKPRLAIMVRKGGEGRQDLLDHLYQGFTANTPIYEKSKEEVEVKLYLVVLCGYKIGFFEFHSDTERLKKEKIRHFRNCISLTQGYSHGTKEELPVIETYNLENIYERSFKFYYRDMEFPECYLTSCIFDMRKHQKEIDILFEHMAKNEPRSIQ